MFSLITLLAFNNIKEPELNKNNIINNCKFEKIRISKNNVKCFDKGKYIKYCYHYSIPNEFIILNEKSINNEKIIIIKPENIIEKTDYSKNIIAKLYYNFECNIKDNNPKLELIIYPTYDINPIIIIIIIIIITIIYIQILSFCKCESNNFTSGYILGTLISSSKSDIYCE